MSQSCTKDVKTRPEKKNSELTTRMAAKLPSAWTNARGVSSRWGRGGGFLRALMYFTHYTRPEKNKKTTRSPRRKRREFQVHSFDRFRAWVPLRCYAGMEPNSLIAGFDILQTNFSLL